MKKPTTADQEFEGSVDEHEEHECEVCGGEHEVTECDQSFCVTCHENVENCGCTVCREVSAEEWVAFCKRGRQ